ncbi:MAG: helix-turn-helix domain-containing protein [Chloroflexota bacterium]|nr:helix-turn-helix domain-containing protein [Chloroflexota bacterium]
MQKPQPTVYRVHDYLKQYQQQHNRAPTLREIAAALDLALSTVDRHLDRLEDMGKIVRERRKARAIRLLDPQK